MNKLLFSDLLNAQSQASIYMSISEDNNVQQKHRVFLNICKELATLSKCVSFQVAALIVKNGRILSTGINGTPSGFLNCCDVFQKDDFNRDEHHIFSETFEIHAEQNAILFAAKNGISIEGADLYCTLHPCNTCLKMICGSGIKQIYYNQSYDKFNADPRIQTLLKQCGISMYQIKM